MVAAAIMIIAEVGLDSGVRSGPTRPRSLAAPRVLSKGQRPGSGDLNSPSSQMLLFQAQSQALWTWGSHSSLSTDNPFSPAEKWDPTPMAVFNSRWGVGMAPVAGLDVSYPQLGAPLPAPLWWGVGWGVGEHGSVLSCTR